MKRSPFKRIDICRHLSMLVYETQAVDLGAIYVYACSIFSRIPSRAIEAASYTRLETKVAGRQRRATPKPSAPRQRVIDYFITTRVLRHVTTKVRFPI